MELTVNKPGDFSDYTLCLVELDPRGRPTDEPLRGFDPRFACISFSFNGDPFEHLQVGLVERVLLVIKANVIDTAGIPVEKARTTRSSSLTITASSALRR